MQFGRPISFKDRVNAQGKIRYVHMCVFRILSTTRKFTNYASTSFTSGKMIDSTLTQ